MNGTLFKTLCQACGLSDREAAHAFDVRDKTIATWGKPSSQVMHDDVHEQLKEWLTHITTRVNNVLEEAMDGQAVHLIKHNPQTYADHPNAATIPFCVEQRALEEAVAALWAAGHTPQVTHADMSHKG